MDEFEQTVEKRRQEKVDLLNQLQAYFNSWKNSADETKKLREMGDNCPSTNGLIEMEIDTLIDLVQQSFYAGAKAQRMILGEPAVIKYVRPGCEKLVDLMEGIIKDDNQN